MILFPLLQGRAVLVGAIVRSVSTCASSTSRSCHRLSHTAGSQTFRASVSVIGARGRLATESRVGSRFEPGDSHFPIIICGSSFTGGGHFAEEISATLTSGAGPLEEAS